MDAIDRSLVALLQGNARLSYAELARQVGLSAPAVHERVGKLESGGVIRAYRAEVEPESIGLGVTALISIVEDSGGDTDDVLEAFRRMPEIESCYFMAGVESFLLKARVGTIAELEQLIVRLNRTPGWPPPVPGSPCRRSGRTVPSRSNRPRPERRLWRAVCHGGRLRR